MEICASKVWLILCWACVLSLAAMLRIDNLEKRAFHFDEATGARITESRVNPKRDYQFNPVHNHGPLLSSAAATVCRIKDESSWQRMTKHTLRLVPVISGMLLVAVPFLWRRRFGDIPVLAAAVLLATSPLLAYYSRMFIHEMMLAMLGLLAVILFFVSFRSRIFKFGTIGFVIGLMFATKETFAISIIAWSAAAGIIALCNWRASMALLIGWKSYRISVASFVVGGTLSAGWFYSDGLTNPSGVWDAVKTFFVYKTTAGHDKPFGYYLNMMIVPTKGGIWWHEGFVFLLALVSVGRSFLPSTKNAMLENTVRFVAYSAVFHLLIYSMISYKTPWLMCLPWAHVCLLAGLSMRGVTSWEMRAQAIAILLLGGVIFQQHRLAKFAAGRFETDTRNPYAYTPTSRNIESAREWLAQMSEVIPIRSLEPIGVVGSEYWPLPWYLRDYQAIGYWRDADPAIKQCPVVFAMMETEDEVGVLLKDSHIALTRTLRRNVPVMMYLRKDHWNKWMNAE